MKRSNSIGDHKTTAAYNSNVTSIHGSTIHGSVHTGSTTINQIHHGRKSQRPTAYPDDPIGSNLLQRNYVRYLVERYHRFREAEASFGSGPIRFSYAVIFKNIERKFKAPTYFVRKCGLVSSWNICSNVWIKLSSASATAREGFPTTRASRSSQPSKQIDHEYGIVAVPRETYTVSS